MKHEHRRPEPEEREETFSGDNLPPEEAFRALDHLTSDQRNDISWADRGEVLHGILVTEAIKTAAYYYEDQDPEVLDFLHGHP